MSLTGITCPAKAFRSYAKDFVRDSVAMYDVVLKDARNCFVIQYVAFFCNSECQTQRNDAIAYGMVPSLGRPMDSFCAIQICIRDHSVCSPLAA